MRLLSVLPPAWGAPESSLYPAWSVQAEIGCKELCSWFGGLRSRPVVRDGHDLFGTLVIHPDVDGSISNSSAAFSRIAPSIGRPS
jgi:hypothetical protein